jgi:hypothetical protein
MLVPLQNDVDTEGAIGQRASGTDPLADGPHRCPAQREHAQAAGIRDRRGQLGRRGTADWRLHDRRRQAEPLTERREPPADAADAALLTWAGAYAVATLVLALFGPAMASWPLVLRTLVLTVTMVVALTWFVMPRLTRLCRPWLSPSG